MNTTVAKPSRPFEAVPGLWKLACALAVLLGHNMVTLTAVHPENGILAGIYHGLQFFSPLQFLAFSGWLAASSLRDRSKPLASFMVGRAVRIYALVVVAFLWGLGMRLALARGTGLATYGTIWPLEVWNGPVDWKDAFMHLSPFGFADHTRFNYATWYLYQELRIVLLFPLFRWILNRSGSLPRWSWLGGLMVASALLEYKFWSHFPLFRSSPIQSVAFGCCFLAGALLWIEFKEGRMARLPGWLVAGALVAGVAVSFFDSFDIRIPIKNPPVLMVPVMVGFVLVFSAMQVYFGKISIPDWLRKACDYSVGVYIVHPPLHVVAAWLFVSSGRVWPIAVEIALALVGGWVFHRLVERPSQILAKTAQSWVA